MSKQEKPVEKKKEEEKFQFDVVEFLKKGLRSSHIQDSTTFFINKQEAFALCDLAMAAFKEDGTLIEVCAPCTVVGDIHGQLPDLIRLLYMRVNNKEPRTKKDEFPWNTEKWVFLGDYVDRGDFSLETICVVFALKVVYGRQYTLLRGNHETRSINHAYGFLDACRNKMGDWNDGNEVWEKFNETFSWMPLACLIGKKLLCMHGGISEQLVSLDAIRNIKRPLIDVSTVKLAEDLLWADPADNFMEIAVDEFPRYIPNKTRGLSVVFNAAAVHDVCKRLDLLMIVRAHQMDPEGFKFFADKKLVTIFSAPQYMKLVNNIGVVLRVQTEGKIYMSRIKNAQPLNTRKPFHDELTQRGTVPVEMPEARSASLPVMKKEEKKELTYAEKVASNQLREMLRQNKKPWKHIPYYDLSKEAKENPKKNSDSVEESLEDYKKRTRREMEMKKDKERAYQKKILAPERNDNGVLHPKSSEKKVDDGKLKKSAEKPSKKKISVEEKGKKSSEKPGKKSAEKPAAPEKKSSEKPNVDKKPSEKKVEDTKTSESTKSTEQKEKKEKKADPPAKPSEKASPVEKKPSEKIVVEKKKSEKKVEEKKEKVEPAIEKKPSETNNTSSIQQKPSEQPPIIEKKASEPKVAVEKKPSDKKLDDPVEPKSLATKSTESKPSETSTLEKKVSDKKLEEAKSVETPLEKKKSSEK